MKQTQIKRKRSTAKRAQGAPDHWIDARGNVCEVCGLAYQKYMVLHHIVRAQHVEAAGGDVWDARNSMTLCGGAFSCHSRHHDRIRVIPTWQVPSSAIEFATELYGPQKAYAYLTREYLGTDHRLEVLIELAA